MFLYVSAWSVTRLYSDKDDKSNQEPFFDRGKRTKGRKEKMQQKLPPSTQCVGFYFCSVIEYFSVCQGIRLIDADWELLLRNVSSIGEKY